jgi:hypothetical protein
MSIVEQRENEKPAVAGVPPFQNSIRSGASRFAPPGQGPSSKSLSS